MSNKPVTTIITPMQKPAPVLATPNIEEFDPKLYPYQVTPIAVDTSLTVEANFVTTDTEEEDDSALETLLEEIDARSRKTKEVVYPHTKSPGAKFDPYLGVVAGASRIDVDENYLLKHLHEIIEMDYSGIDWKPREIPEYTDTDIMYMDIETTGLDSDSCQIHMIGVKLDGPYKKMPERYMKYDKLARVGLIFTVNNPKWDRILYIPFGLNTFSMPDGREFGVFVCKSEKDLLQVFSKYVKEMDPAITPFHNGFAFDLPFISRRCEINGLVSPVTVVKATDKSGNYRPLFNSAASIDGKSIMFDAAYWAQPNAKGRIYNDGSFPQVFDTYHAAGQYDKLHSCITNYGLKGLVRDHVKARDCKRTELTYPQMMAGWDNGGHEWKTFLEYLIYDLDDTKILTDYFIASTWEQQRFMPLPLQEISYASPAKKWNAIIEEYYRPLEGRRMTTRRNGSVVTQTYRRPIADQKVAFEGALAKVSPGLYKGWFKVDVASLYPSIMLLWKLFDQKKDPLGLALFILQQARELRYVYKKAGNKAVDAALKVLLNGMYGWMGTGGYPTNSITTSAIVTALGRVMLRLMCHAAEPYGRMIECFTQDTLITTDRGVFAIVDIVDKEVNVVNGNGDWSAVTFTKRSDAQEIYNVTLKRDKKIVTVRCNGAHRWYAAPFSPSLSKRKFCDYHTEDMVGNKWYVPSVLTPKPADDNTDYYNGIVHGIIYGDGYKPTYNDATPSLNNNHNGQCFFTQLVNEKMDLVDYFSTRQTIGILTAVCDRNTDTYKSIATRFYSHHELKELPSLESSNSYLLGFTRGLIATDGNVDHRDGTTDISGAKETIDFIEKIGCRTGLEVSRVNVSNKAGRTTIIRGRECTQKIDTHRAFFVGRNVTLEDTLHPFHHDKLKAVRDRSSIGNSPWVVINVEKTTDVESVYCCVEPVTHSFVLTSNILSKNCDTDGILVQQVLISGPADPECVEFTKDLIENLKISIGKTEAGKKLDGLTEELAYQEKLLVDMLDESLGVRIIHTPAFIHHKMQAVLPPAIVLELENNYPEGAIFAPKAKNYIKWKTPDSYPDAKGNYRKRNRTIVQKTHVIKYVEIMCFQGVDKAIEYRNAVINGMRILSHSLAVGNAESVPEPVLLPTPDIIEITVNDIAIKSRIATNDKKMQASGMGTVGEVIHYYWGHRYEVFKKPSKDGTFKRTVGKHFPIALHKDVETGDFSLDVQDFPDDIDPQLVTFALNLERYELDYINTTDAVMAVMEQCSARTSNAIDTPGLTLPEWWLIENQPESGSFSGKYFEEQANM